ncbi:MAG: 50S ribosomal protein L24 [candidate division TA06 bacterium 32_111]|uniref:Large ribosomal subunit protein uL24 n=1 Tax=candidate division WOR-3 bacterium TaxID=2052148 RepID=A0A348MIM8_UNCW3|nr:MAG: 50S ribosomal protein L24 [candidate division TA06 bacterium 32_111]HAF06904.1 50S ribosomal protein L24 [candidate division WOR-3 bacterium]HCP15961.1 50S ribosomal protein L24 [candidate division WOR-3 bacterium]
MEKFNIRKDDLVIVIRGEDKGKKGRVLKIFRDKRKAIVEGVNVVKRHQKARKQGEKSGIIEKEAPVSLSNLMLVCPKCNTPTKIGHTKNENKSVRYCKNCREMIVR